MGSASARLLFVWGRIGEREGGIRHRRSLSRDGIARDCAGRPRVRAGAIGRRRRGRGIRCTNGIGAAHYCEQKGFLNSLPSRPSRTSDNSRLHAGEEIKSIGFVARQRQMSERWGSEAGRRPVYDQAVNEEATNSQLVGGCFPSDLTPTILPVVSTILCTRNRRGKLPLTLTIYKGTGFSL